MRVPSPMHDSTSQSACPDCGQRPKHVRVGGSLAVVCACRAHVLRTVGPHLRLAGDAREPRARDGRPPAA